MINLNKILRNDNTTIVNFNRYDEYILSIDIAIGLLYNNDRVNIIYRMFGDDNNTMHTLLTVIKNNYPELGIDKIGDTIVLSDKSNTETTSSVTVLHETEIGETLDNAYLYINDFSNCRLDVINKVVRDIECHKKNCTILNVISNDISEVINSMIFTNTSDTVFIDYNNLQIIE